MLQSIVWLLIIEFIGVLALPATFAFFSFLPDRGYAFSKVFGLLGGAFVVWFLGMLGLPFTALTSWLLLVGLFVGLNIWLLRRKQGELQLEVGDFLRERRWLIVAVELLFIVAYFYLVNMRSFMPEIRDQEKFGDFAFLNSMALHSTLPPTDPWMSGYTINYYYFSHFILAMLTKMSGIAPAIAFNLAIPLIFALTAIAAFGIAFNLVAIARNDLRFTIYDLRFKPKDDSLNSNKMPKSSIVNRQSSILLAAGLVGLLAAVNIGILGNFDSARQVLFPAANQPQLGSFNYNWWSPSRVISDFMPQPIGGGIFEYRSTEAITEFPMFSFLLADIHPHVMTLPFVLLVIAAALNLLRVPAGGAALNLRTGEGRYFLIGLGVMVGALYFLNSLDYPTYLLLVVLAALVRELRVGGLETKISGSQNLLKAALLGGEILVRQSSQFWGRTVRWLGFSVRLAIISLLFYLPFHLTFTSFIGDSFVPEAVNLPILSSLAKTFLLVAWDRTPLISQTIIQENGTEIVRWGYLMVFGIFLYPIVAMLALKVWPYLKAPYAYLDEVQSSPTGQPFGPKFNPPGNPSGRVQSLGEVPGSGNEDFDEDEEQVEAEETTYGPRQFGSTAYLVAGFGLAILLVSEITWLLRINPVITLLAGITAIPVLAVGVGLMAADFLAKIRSERPARELLTALGVLALLMISLGWILHFELYGPLLILIISAGLLVFFELKLPASGTEKGAATAPVQDTENRALLQADQFALLLVLLPAFLTFVIEIIFLRDIFNARFNTIFKFYYQAWAMYGLAAAYASWRVAAWGWKLLPFKQPDKFEEDTNIFYSPSRAQPSPTGMRAAVVQTQMRLEAAGANGTNLAFSVFQAPERNAYLDTQVAPDKEALAAEEYVRQQPRPARWRWVWALGLILLLLAGLIYPIFGPYEKTGHFKERRGLDGEQWLTEWYPEDFTAIKWLRAQAARDSKFEGTILETYGPDWFDYNRVGTFSGFPILMGWPGHEQQWRGGKAETRLEVSRRMNDIDTIYATNDIEQARSLLQKYGVKYVYVGTLETGARDGRWYDGGGKVVKKNYPPEALSKFSIFMKPIYQQDGVTIYSF